MKTRELRLTSAFKHDLKRERKTDRQIDTLLEPVLNALLANEKLEPGYRDHALTGDWRSCRECHVKPDLLLVYDLPDETTLVLIRLGSHSALNF